MPTVRRNPLQAIYAIGERSLPLKESTVVLRMAVDHRPGDYHFLNAYYRSEYTIGVLGSEGDAPTPSFRVVRDAASQPSFNLELIDNSAEQATGEGANPLDVPESRKSRASSFIHLTNVRVLEGGRYHQFAQAFWRGKDSSVDGSWLGTPAQDG